MLRSGGNDVLSCMLSENGVMFPYPMAVQRWAALSFCGLSGGGTEQIKEQAQLRLEPA